MDLSMDEPWWPPDSNKTNLKIQGQAAQGTSDTALFLQKKSKSLFDNNF